MFLKIKLILMFLLLTIFSCSKQEVVRKIKRESIPHSEYNEEPLVKKVAMINFENDSINIQEHELKNIERTAALLQTIDKKSKILIKGHTDKSGDENYNYKLGLNRALKIKTQLVNRGVPPANIYVVSFGESRPLIEAIDVDEKYINRRATIEILVPIKTGSKLSMK